jgi:hypothetical protein
MNGYVEAGWSVTAGVLAIYTWRVLHRGRVLIRALPPVAPPGAASTTPAHPTVTSAPAGGTARPATATAASTSLPAPIVPVAEPVPTAHEERS